MKHNKWKWFLTGILIRMPCNLAFFDTNAVLGIQAPYPQIKTWILGGHSLGGAAAAMCAASHPEEFDGLLLILSITRER